VVGAGAARRVFEVAVFEQDVDERAAFEVVSARTSSFE